MSLKTKEGGSDIDKGAGDAVKVSAWPIALGSIGFSFTSLFLFGLYSTLHWKVLSHHQEMTEELKTPLFYMLGSLEFYRLFALVALVWSIWAFRGRPKWLAWLSLPFALVALGVSIIFQ